MANNKSVLETEKEMLPTKLRKLLEESKMTQTELAGRLNMTRQNLAGYLNGQIKVIPYDKIVKLAEIFGVSTDYLLTDIQTRSPDMSMRTAVEMTGLSEDSIQMLNTAPAGRVIEFLLHDGNDILWQNLSGFLGTALPQREEYLEIDAYNPEIKKTSDAEEPWQPNVYKVKNTEIVEQVLLNEIVKNLKEYKKGYYSWVLEHYSEH